MSSPSRGVLVPVVRVLGERLEDYRLQKSRHIAVVGAGGRMSTFRTFPASRIAVRVEQSFPGDNLVKNGADGKDVGSPVDRKPSHLLRRHVSEFPFRIPAWVLDAWCCLCYSEVYKLYVSVV